MHEGALAAFMVALAGTALGSGADTHSTSKPAIREIAVEVPERSGRSWVACVPDGAGAWLSGPRGLLRVDLSRPIAVAESIEWKLPTVAPGCQGVPFSLLEATGPEGGCLLVYNMAGGGLQTVCGTNVGALAPGTETCHSLTRLDASTIACGAAWDDGGRRRMAVDVRSGPDHRVTASLYPLAEIPPGATQRVHVRSDGGRVVVGNLASATVMVFDQTGRELRRIDLSHRGRIGPPPWKPGSTPPTDEEVSDWFMSFTTTRNVAAGAGLVAATFQESLERAHHVVARLEDGTRVLEWADESGMVVEAIRGGEVVLSNRMDRVAVAALPSSGAPPRRAGD